MDLQYNKTDSEVLPITNTRISASEYNQIAGSLMQIITSAGLTPDGGDNTQLLNAVKSFIGRTVIETYSNGTSWYRVWSDGWCEQGGYFENTQTSSGNVTLTFLKEFANTNYLLVRTDNKGTFTNNQNTQYMANYVSKTTSSASFRLDTKSYLLGFDWMACGYIA